MKKFRLYSGELINDLGEYIKNYIEQNPDVLIYIGTDSVDRKQTIYVTTICFRHPHAGAHVIYKREREIKSPDLFTKLWREVEKSSEVGNYVKDYIFNGTHLTIDLDLSPLPRNASNITHDAARGYMIAQGFKVRSKPQAWSATRAADHLLR